jgi:hypothetical protein
MAAASFGIEQARRLVQEWMGQSPESLRNTDRLVSAIARLLEQERDACAAVADRGGQSRPAWQEAAMSIAAAIRERGRTQERHKAEKDALRLTKTFLKLAKGHHYCLRCLASELRFGLRVAQQAMKELSRTEGFDVGVYWCRVCGENREVIWARLEHAPRWRD